MVHPQTYATVFPGGLLGRYEFLQANSFQESLGMTLVSETII